MNRKSFFAILFAILITGILCERTIASPYYYIFKGTVILNKMPYQPGLGELFTDWDGPEISYLVEVDFDQPMYTDGTIPFDPNSFYASIWSDGHLWWPEEPEGITFSEGITWEDALPDDSAFGKYWKIGNDTWNGFYSKRPGGNSITIYNTSQDIADWRIYPWEYTDGGPENVPQESIFVFKEPNESKSNNDFYETGLFAGTLFLTDILNSNFQSIDPTMDPNHPSYIPLTNAVPEPATMLLLGSGLIGLAGFRRKIRKRNM